MFISLAKLNESGTPHQSLQNENQFSNPAPPHFPLWLLDDFADSNVGADEMIHAGDVELDGISSSVLKIVWMELARDLAKVPLPRMGPSTSNAQYFAVGTDDDPEGDINEEDREFLSRYEWGVWQKIKSAVDYLCFFPDDCKGWFDVAQCLGSKADFICDRIVNIANVNNERDFFPWPTVFHRARNSNFWSLEELERLQLSEEEEIERHWLPCLGRDLSVYVRQPWSTLPTLRHCAEEVGEGIHNNESDEVADDGPKNHAGRLLMEKEAWRCIESLEFREWQKAWGGLYISALRIMANRCHQVTYYLAKRKELVATEGRDRDGALGLVAEICETVGTTLYIELQGSWRYGYPIHRMTEKAKRDLAEEAANNYQEALNLTLISSSNVDDDIWGLHLMIGKVGIIIWFSEILLQLPMFLNIVYQLGLTYSTLSAPSAMKKWPTHSV